MKAELGRTGEVFVKYGKIVASRTYDSKESRDIFLYSYLSRIYERYKND
jgi:hypothetical protein